jgi:hypothetical protein
MRFIVLLPCFAIAASAWGAPPSAIHYGSMGGNVSVFHVAAQPAARPPATEAGAPAAYANPSAPQGQVATNGDDDAVIELTRLRAEQQKAWETINGNNPLSASFGTGVPGTSAGTGPFEQINKILSQPAVQAYMKFFTNPIFSKGVDQIIKSPQRMTLLYVEIGLVVFMLIFRAWRFSKSTHWVGRLWTKIWTLVLFWLLALVAVPWAVLGDPYYQTIRGALDVLLVTKK